MEQDTKVCGHCGEAKPEPEWHPSHWAAWEGSWCKACYRERHRRTYTPRSGADDDPRPCVWCGVVYQPKRRTVSLYCSRKCKESARYPRPVSRSCGYCGSDFVPVRNGQCMCSRPCSMAAHRLQSRLRARTGEPTRPGILRAAIAERDNWTCTICCEPVDRSVKYPDPLSPSLDHIVPVSKGGTNDDWNLRLAHMRCNQARGNRAIQYLEASASA